MNLVIDDAVEITLATKDREEERRKIGEEEQTLLSPPAAIHANILPGQILLKGDNIALIQQIQS